MNILIIHEIDWVKKIIFEPHHIAELLSLQKNNVYVIDCREPDFKRLLNGFQTKIIENYHRVYQNAEITIIRPTSFLIKGLNRISYFLFYKSVLKKIIKEKNIEIILLYGVATNGIQTIKVAKECGIPVIYRALDVVHGLVKIQGVRQLVKKYEKHVIKNSTMVLTTTPDMSRYAIRMGVKKDNVEIFDLGINLNVFRPLTKENALLNKYGISQKDKVIAFMGTLYDFSGMDDIILGYDTLKKSLGDVKILIIGDGPASRKIKKIIKNKHLENKVIITGFIPQSEIPRYIALSDICINPFRINFITNSILPTKILEYLACGKAVISTPLKGTIEMLPNNEYGVTYSISEKIIDDIINLLQDSKKITTLEKNGINYIKSKHDWNVLSKKLLQKFEEVVQ